ncbi:MAG: hypothetical protein AB1458_03650 [Bacteroidota bacterium]
MKNSVKLAALALVIAATSFSGCKKGENDPFVSLKSRKSRVAGSWKITKGEGKDVNGSTTTTWTYDGTTWTQTTGSTTTTLTVEQTYTFEKDGTWKGHYMESTTGYSNTVDQTGTWNFTSGVGEMKNKSQIVLMVLTDNSTTVIGTSTSTSSTTYTGSNAPTMIYDIDQLKSKEMVWKWKGSTASGSATSSDEGMMTATAQ